MKKKRVNFSFSRIVTNIAYTGMKKLNLYVIKNTQKIRGKIMLDS